MSFTLYQYARYYIGKGLNSGYSLDDCLGYAITQVAGNKQLQKDFAENAVPKGRNLSLFRSILSNSKTAWLNKEYYNKCGFRREAILKKKTKSESIHNFIQSFKKNEESEGSYFDKDVKCCLCKVILFDKNREIAYIGLKAII